MERAITETITVEECASYLKFLAVIAKLRHDISTSDRLFGINDSEAHDQEKNDISPQSGSGRRDGQFMCLNQWIDSWPGGRVVYLSMKAQQGFLGLSILYHHLVGRYSCTISVCIGLTLSLCVFYLDVLMVWHSYMLYPRSFLADCMRLCKMGSGLQDYPGRCGIVHRRENISLRPRKQGNPALRGANWLFMI